MGPVEGAVSGENVMLIFAGRLRVWEERGNYPQPRTESHCGEGKQAGRDERTGKRKELRKKTWDGKKTRSSLSGRERGVHGARTQTGGYV